MSLLDDLGKYYRKQDGIKLAERKKEEDRIIQQRNRWADIIKVISSRMIAHFRKHPPEDHCWIKFWDEGRGDSRFKRWLDGRGKDETYEVLSWPIYTGCPTRYETSSHDSDYTGDQLNLLEDGRLSSVSYSNSKPGFFYQSQSISLDYVNNLETSFGFSRMVIFQAMTRKALELGVISNLESSRWEEELTEMYH